MSLFGSIYEEAGDGPDAPAAAPDPVSTPADQADEAADHAPAQDAVPSSMSLQDFAAEVFGSAPLPGGDSMPGPGDEHPLGDSDSTGSRQEPLDVPAQAADGAEAVSAFASFNAAAEAPATAAEAPATAVATVETEFADLVAAPESARPTEPAPAPEAAEPLLSPFDTDNSPVEGDATLDAPPVPMGSDEAFDTPLLDDDLLPAHKPKRAVAVPSLALGRFRRPVKLLVILLVVGIAGFVGFRTLSGGGDGTGQTSDAEGVAGAGTVQLGDLPVSGALDPRDAGAVINSVQLVGAEAELRDAATWARVHYADTGSFAFPAAEWTNLMGRTVVDGTSGTPAPGLLRVVSDEDAVCFETATDAGATVAVGVTDAGGIQRFASDPAGGSLCTVDAAVLAGWQPSLIGL